MRLWRKRSTTEENRTAQEEAENRAGEDETVASGDPALPGVAGYREGRPDTLLSRFTYVRPDGKPELKRKRGSRRDT